jgi:hypothetical protein
MESAIPPPLRDEKDAERPFQLDVSAGRIPPPFSPVRGWTDGEPDIRPPGDTDAREDPVGGDTAFCVYDDRVGVAAVSTGRMCRKDEEEDEDE